MANTGVVTIEPTSTPRLHLDFIKFLPYREPISPKKGQHAGRLNRLNPSLENALLVAPIISIFL